MESKSSLLAAKAGVGLALYALLLLVVSLILIAMGAYLLSLGGSPYYLIAGVALAVPAVMLWRGDKRASWAYGLLLLATLVWALWEVGLNGWGLVARLAAWIVLGLPMAWIWLGSARNRLIGFGGLAVAVVAGLAVATASPVMPPEPFEAPATAATDGEWPYVGRTIGGTRYAPVAQINTSNVRDLEVAWTYRAGTAISEATPLKIGDSLYFCTADNTMIALDAERGTERWRYDPKLRPNRPAPFCRGVAYHRSDDAEADAACRERIFTSTRDTRLIAVDAATGKPCADFGEQGTVDLRENMGPDPVGYQYSSSPPLVIGDNVIVGTGIFDGPSTGEPSGVVRAFNARTGDLAWAWDIGRPGINTAPEPGETYARGTPNVWGLTSADPELGLVYLPTGNATPDFVGTHRTPEMDKFSSSVVALNAADGSVRWHFQTTHHDIWDYDVASQPVLTDFPTADGPVPALIQPTKRGEIFVLDRRTGEPLVTTEERPVPQGAVEGDFVTPTQPFSTGIPTFRRPTLREADMWGLTPIDHMWCRIKFREARYEGHLTPLGLKPVIVYPATVGGSNWGSVSVDERSGIMLGASNDIANYIRLIPRDSSEAPKYDEVNETGFPVIPPWIGSAQRGTPYAVHNPVFYSPLTVPCTRPPFGRLTAIDMKSRKVLWEHPLGTTRKSGPFGLQLGLSLPMGVPLTAGVLVTAGNLSFFSGSQDGYVRAFSTKTGNLLWRVNVASGSGSTPMTYLAPQSGRQVLLVMGGGGFQTGESGDHVVAYALPSGE